MKDYYEYNHEEIETIAEKFANNEFVNHDELALWYEYKQAVKTYISNGKKYFQMIEKDEEDYGEFTKNLLQDQNKAEGELRWIRSIKTFPLEDFCNYYELSYDYNIGEDRPSITMVNRVIDGASETEKSVIRELMEESDMIKSINNFRDLTTPVHLRRWTYMNRNPTEYCPVVSSTDATQLYDGKEHYVYIVKECTNHRWGESYWISVDCDNTCYSLPVIKAFKEYDFEIGKFYKIICTDTIHFGGNKKKYIMSIEESNEEEFLTKGLTQYATRW